MPDAPAANPGNFASIVTARPNPGGPAPTSAAATTSTQTQAPAMPHPGNVSPVNVHQQARQQAQAGTQPGSVNNQPAAPVDPTLRQPGAQQQQQSADPNADPAVQAAAQAAAAQAAAVAADPWLEQVHGVSLRELADAVKAGELPQAFMENFPVKVPVPGGREITVPLEEARRGYMRISDHTRKTQEVANLRTQVEETKGKVAKLFENWDKPEGFAASVEAIGMTSHARAMVTKNWKTPDGKPNVQGFLDDMRRLGHYDVLRAVANQMAGEFNQRMSVYNPEGPANEAAERRALQLYVQDEARENGRWKAQIEAENLAESLRRDRAKLERAQLLQQQPRPQQTQAEAQQVQQQINQVRDATFQKLGVAPKNPREQAVTLQYYHENFEALCKIAASEGYGESVLSIAQKAAQATAEQLSDIASQNGGSTTTQQPTGLPAQRGAAPVTAANGGRRGGSPAELEAAMRSGTFGR